MSNPSLAAQIAHLALNTFDTLPKKCKPRVQADGRQEWTPMSAVILSRHDTTALLNSDAASCSTEHDLKIICLATGTKSLPVSALPRCNGLVLHDCHAEILALRGFNYWLLCEVERMLAGEGNVSPWLERREQYIADTMQAVEPGDGCQLPYRLRQDVEISLFSTEAPCGDASMELLMKAAEAAGRDVSPWAAAPAASQPLNDSDSKQRSGSDTCEDHENAKLPPGRGYFSNLGALRRKPARADAEISMSRSCSDKLMLKQFTGLLSFPLDLLIERTDAAYLSRMVVYQDQHNRQGYERAFDKQGRLREAVKSSHDGQSEARFFEVEVLPKGFRRFEFEKAVSREDVIMQENKKPSNISTIWIAGDDENGSVVEVLVNGVKQGYKQFDHRESKASVVCRRKLLEKATRVDQLLKADFVKRGMRQDPSRIAHYSEIKSMPQRHPRRHLKQRVFDALGGWPSKGLDDDFNITSLSQSITDSTLSYPYLPMFSCTGFSNPAAYHFA